MEIYLTHDQSTRRITDILLNWSWSGDKSTLVRQLVAEIIREKMLRLLDREVPHGVAVGIERWNEREDGLVEINAVIYCEKASHKGIIIGKEGAMLKEIGRQARADIERMLDTKVYLELWVKVKEGWRNNQYQMRNFGYEEQ